MHSHMMPHHAAPARRCHAEAERTDFLTQAQTRQRNLESPTGLGVVGLRWVYVATVLIGLLHHGNTWSGIPSGLELTSSDLRYSSAVSGVRPTTLRV